MTTFDIVLLEKETDTGLTKADCIDLYDMLKESEAYPLEILKSNGASAALGFITCKAAENIDYNYSSLETYVEKILEDTNLETENHQYNHQNLDIYLSR